MRVPPQNIEAEQGVLGGVLYAPETLHDIRPILSPEHFYRDSHQAAFRVICDLYDSARPVDAITVAEELERRGELARVGGREGLAEFIGGVPHAANAKYHAQIVREKWEARALAEACNATLDEVYANSMTAADLLAAAETRVLAIAGSDAAEYSQPIAEAVASALALRSRSGAGDAGGVPSGLSDLDDLIGAMQPGRLLALAARPGMGKSALAFNICENAVVNLGLSALFISLEMGHTELGERFLASRARIDGRRFRSGDRLNQVEQGKLDEAIREASRARLVVDAAPSRTSAQIAAIARRHRRNHGLDLLVLDYVQLVDTQPARGESRQEVVAKISQRMKALAREIQAPVIMLSQLNRMSEQREDRRPRMSDLRESGAIEQDADVVLLLHRPEYYDPNDQPGVAELHVAKNRGGGTGAVRMTFLKTMTRFVDLAEEPVTSFP